MCVCLSVCLSLILLLGWHLSVSLSYIITRVAPHCVNTLRILHSLSLSLCVCVCVCVCVCGVCALWGSSGPGRALRPTGGCVQSWVAHHGHTGSGAEPQKKILPNTTIFRTKNACSEDVKHLVQKLSSRPPRIWAHTTQHDVSRVVRLRQGQGGKAKGWPTWRAGMGSAGAGLAGGGAPWAGPAGHKPIQPAQR